MILDKRQFISNLLQHRFNELKKKNPRYSVRAFAKKIGISSAALSEILNQKRSISEKKAISLLKRLNPTDTEYTQIKAAYSKVGRLEKLKTQSNPRNEIILTEENFDLMSDWRYFAFMALTRTTGFISDSTWISKRLGVSKKEVGRIILKLGKLGIVKVDASGKITDNNACYRTPNHFPADLERSRQIDGLRHVEKLLRNGEESVIGNFSTITTDTVKLQEAALMIEDFLKRLSLFLCDSADRREVYELQIQLFPRTKSI